MTEVAGRTLRRVQLQDVSAVRSRLLGHSGQDLMNRLGVVEVTEQLAQAGANDVTPGEGRLWQLGPAGLMHHAS